MPQFINTAAKRMPLLPGYLDLSYLLAKIQLNIFLGFLVEFVTFSKW